MKTFFVVTLLIVKFILQSVVVILVWFGISYLILRSQTNYTPARPGSLDNLDNYFKILFYSSPLMIIALISVLVITVIKNQKK